jgi:hypothetical protein
MMPNAAHFSDPPKPPGQPPDAPDPDAPVPVEEPPAPIPVPPANPPPEPLHAGCLCFSQSYGDENTRNNHVLLSCGWAS